MTPFDSPCVTFDIKQPRFVQELLDRKRSLIVNYGRMTEKDVPTLNIFFQGWTVYTLANPVLGSKPIDWKAVAKQMEDHCSANPRWVKLSHQESSVLVTLLKSSVLLNYFNLTNAAKKRHTSLCISSNHRLVWRASAFEFEERYTEGKRIEITYPTSPAWSGYTPPEAMKKRRASVCEQTAEEAEEQIRKELDFWLFGPST